METVVYSGVYSGGLEPPPPSPPDNHETNLAISSEPVSPVEVRWVCTNHPSAIVLSA